MMLMITSCKINKLNLKLINTTLLLLLLYFEFHLIRSSKEFNVSGSLDWKKKKKNFTMLFYIRLINLYIAILKK